MRLLTDSGPHLADHLAVHGPLPDLAPAHLLDLVDAAGLLGRGGAGFPTGRKLRAVAAGRRTVVLGNACEGEPASSKDTLLLGRHPHLVLDGLQVAARAVGAGEVHLALHDDSPVRDALAAALRERSEPVAVHLVPPRYVSSEESALVNLVERGVALPTSTPPRPYERGIGGRPTLVQNAETLAQLALVARHGAAWWRAVGDPSEPGTALVTVSGPGVRHVVEVPTGEPVGALLARAGLTDLQAVLVGGYFGTWLPAAAAARLPLTHRDLRAAGGALGAGIVVGLPAGACGLLETARVAAYLSRESAGQCGPCLNGLPAIAGAVHRLAVGPWDDRTTADLARWLAVVPGRGACRHPDGAVRFVPSALSVFADDVAQHRRGRPCAGVHGVPVLPVPVPRSWA